MKLATRDVHSLVFIGRSRGVLREITNDIRDIVGSVAVEKLMVVLLGD